MNKIKFENSRIYIDFYKYEAFVKSSFILSVL